jgi:type I restriction enzyme S subunit
MKNKLKKRFGDIAEQIMLRVTPKKHDAEYFIGLDDLKSKHIYVHTWGSDLDLKTQAFKVKQGDIIFSRRNTYLRRASVSQIDGICSADAMVIRPISEDSDPRFLPFFMQSDLFMNQVIAYSAGSLSSRIKWSDLSNLEFDIPSIQSQRRLLPILESTAKQELQLIGLIKSAEKALYALGLRVFDNYFDSRHHKRVPLPKNWGQSRINNVLLTAPKSGYSPVESPLESGHFVLNLNSLSRNGFLSTKLKNITKAHFDKGIIAKRGDLLISRSNTSYLVGLIGIYNPIQGEENTIFPDTMWRLDVDDSKIDKEFLLFYLMSPYGRRSIQSIAAGTSGSMKKINKDGFGKLWVPLPPKEEQEQITSSFKCAYELIQKTKINLVKLHELRAALINE